MFWTTDASAGGQDADSRNAWGDVGEGSMESEVGEEGGWYLWSAMSCSRTDSVMMVSW